MGQSQTILQKQIDRFGKHVFQEGSIVVPGQFNLFSDSSESGAVLYVKVRDVDTSNNVVNIDNFLNQTVTGNTSIAGTLGVTGAATLSSTLDVAGNFNVNTNKF